MREHTKLIGTVATLALAALAVLALTITGGAAVASQDVTIDDPDNDTVEVDVDYSAGVDATVELINGSGDVVDSQTITGTSGATETFSVSASNAGDYAVNLTTAGTESNVSLNETRLIAERSVEVTDAANETVYVDLAFQGSSNATADIDVATDAGSTIATDTIEYDATSDTSTYTMEVNESDGLIADTYTVTATVTSASAFEAAYATLEDPNASSGFFGGEILGQDTSVAIAGLLVLGGGYYYAREEDYL